MFGPSNERLIVSTEGGALLSYDVASGECIDERCDVEMEIPDITFSTDQMLFIAAVFPPRRSFLPFSRPTRLLSSHTPLP